MTVLMIAAIYNHQEVSLLLNLSIVYLIKHVLLILKYDGSNGKSN